MNVLVDDESIFDLISEFLSSKNLKRTIQTLEQERSIVNESNNGRKATKSLSSSKLGELLTKLKVLELKSHQETSPKLAEEELVENESKLEKEQTEGLQNEDEDDKGSKQPNGKERDLPSPKKTPKKHGITFTGLLDLDDSEDEKEFDEDGDPHYATDSQSSSRVPSRSTSRTSSILRPRSESVGSMRSSKSVSFATSEEEESSDTDEWSDDEDPGYVKIPMEDFFPYSDDEGDITKESIEYSFDQTLEDNMEQIQFGELTDKTPGDFEVDWEEPATQDTLDDNLVDDVFLTTQETDLTSQDPIFAEPVSQDYVSLSSSLPMETVQQLNESFNQEDFEVDKLNELLQDQIQLQRDEYYQEPFGVKQTKPSLISKGKKTEETKEMEDDKTEIEFESFELPIIYEKGRTGLEESKDYPINTNAVISGRYQILEYIGSAAFSQAVRCLDLQNQQQVCIKIIKNNKEFFDQSLDEIKLLQYINAHCDPDTKNVLQLYDYFYHKEHLFIVSELLRDNLYEFYKYNRESGEDFYFTLDRLKKITKQCLVALEYIHSLNLIHCDLKPENILIKSYSRCEVKIIDFGSSCFTQDHLSTYVQSRSYRAPEVILGLPYGAKIDMWSLGCILAELWTGKVLFQNESISTLLARIIGILGPFSDEMLQNGRCVYKYFTKSKALFEQREGQPGFIYLKPKRTALRSRLKCDDPVFVDFIQKLLSLDPEQRPSASEALKHSFVCD